MLPINRQAKVVHNCQSGNVPDDIHTYEEPVILKGLVDHWELVKIGLESDSKTAEYLKSFYNGKPTLTYFGEPGLDGRYGYNETATDLNFKKEKAQLDQVIDLIITHLNDETPPSLYIASNVIDLNFPGLRKNNDLDMSFATRNPNSEPPIPSIWIGNKSIARCHYDASDNIACVVKGRRRFIMFPPDQIENLYPGPLSPTPGGQAITMVDLHNPDYQQFPKFKQAAEKGMIAELEPGDGIFIPSMWWHQVEGLNNFNILVNYWWSNAERFMGSAMNVLHHAMLSLRDKPAHEKAAWKHVFDYYIFNNESLPTQHLPVASQGLLSPMDELKSRQLRAMLINKLNR
ncbi:cupin-like domain-containing protein [Alteromonas gilva]|uniref:Cupin-like domain-containing protein n=1 Tax=Alteromonas gilva TaxID=2987522 RepID=A0ABT5L8Z2_9ALTE|nr:cupin-like domain-containing protein [Alteromonas gilva]MDC8832477.1 cupin-like domain-containing protein [Alteromonas gilva]